ncbi:uncharacterized protein LOC106160810 [Lingula anatina]|uniref:Uncharacterized protein LOC106160810 n=1 Tax=Lingula anatina TaxID=7574 RepID=A0A1S3I426_LINAN|nr:uncharacterized protein LOC106160810 [Lingula anatina]|eukprot:XP_013393020.1 uncharacterized protein LOC106160810 [Lingula anatina]
MGCACSCLDELGVPTDIPLPTNLSRSVKKELYEDLEGYDWPFENLVLEGGGAKGNAYPGALQVLEELGILKKIKRFGGASAGACTAGMLALGYTPRDIAALLDLDQEFLVQDAHCGKLAMLPNLYCKFGWNPGKRYIEVLRLYVREATGKADYTFGDLYRDRGIELCVVVTNVTKMGIEYLHPKTTPDMPIAEAMQMSSSIPGFFQPPSYKKGDHLEYYVDGGMLCNYPVHVFDGWYLSMRPEDSFFQRLGSEEPPFHKYNEKTLGLIVYATDEQDLMKVSVHQSCKDVYWKLPDTKLAGKRGPQFKELQAEIKKKAAVIHAAKTFFPMLKACDLDKDGNIDLHEFKLAMDRLSQTNPDVIETLFGKDMDWEEAFKEIDTDSSLEFTAAEFMSFLERKGVVSPLEYISDVSLVPIKTLGDFTSALINTFTLQAYRQFLKPRDPERTVGIYTNYIQALDLDMAKQDKIFLRKQGAIGVAEFLRSYLERKNRQDEVLIPESVLLQETARHEERLEQLEAEFLTSV